MFYYKEKSLYECEVVWCIGKVELEKIWLVDISEILCDVVNGYDDNKFCLIFLNDLMCLLRNLFDYGIKLDVIRFNLVLLFCFRDVGGEEKVVNYLMNEDEVIEFFMKFWVILA